MTLYSKKAGMPSFQLNVEELEKALERLADPVVLGESNLKSLKSVAQQLQSKEQPVSALETGRAISQVLKASLGGGYVEVVSVQIMPTTGDFIIFSTIVTSVNIV